MSVTRALLPLLLGLALAGVAPAPWRAVQPGGALVPTAAPRPPRSCPALHLPALWDVRARVYADVTGDGQPECVLSVWRPWRDWPTRRWAPRGTPITGNRDARGFSAHVAVLRPLRGGAYRQVWVGSALYQPVTALTVLPDGRLVTLETTYARGRDATATALSEWRWTGFGFRLERRVPVLARELRVDPAGRPAIR